jgi:hypothetical protein
MTVTDWMTKNGKDNDGKGPNIENNDDDNGAHGEYNEMMIPFIYTIYIYVEEQILSISRRW